MRLWRFQIRQQTISFVCLCTLFTLAPPAVPAADEIQQSPSQAAQFSGIDRALARLEQKVFGMENSEQPVATRLEILENKVFNRPQDGSLIERVSNLNVKTGALPAPTNNSVEAKQNATAPRTIMKGTIYDSEIARFGIYASEELQPGSFKKIVVKSVTPLSPAEVWGIAPGDVILAVHTNPSSTVVTISRNDKIYSAELSATRETIYTTRGSIGR